MKRRPTNLLLAALVLAVTACAAPTSSDKRAPDSEPARRIVSLAPALTEILFALDLGERVVGVTDYCDYPPEAAHRAHVGGYVNPSVESVLALHPDLVVVSPAAGNRDAALTLQRTGVRLEVIPAETLAETLAAIESVGRVCGAPERAAALARSVRERIDAASARVRDLPKVKTLFCVQIDPLIAAGAGTLPAELLELAGGINVVRATRYPQVGIEAVLTEAPEVILQATMDATSESSAPVLQSYWQRWSTIPAVRNGRVYVFDATVALRPGPRVADAVERLAELLH